MAADEPDINSASDQLQDQSPDAPPLREVSLEELEQILEDHQKRVESADYEKWLRCNGEEKLRLATGRADLTKANLTKKTLRNVKLKGADIRYSLLREADLKQSDLQAAEKAECPLYSPRLRSTTPSCRSRPPARRPRFR